MIRDRKFVCYFYFVGWLDLSLGISVGLAQPNLEIHLPFGFIRIGWAGEEYGKSKSVSERIFGYTR